ncbi:MAG: DUF6080 domain-containing protein [Prevotella sp.]|jgi:hypothetical protein|nr:DUF6080 domain-containing protein [Prevotella sp.]MCI1282145.1 DUF6080 domain-containing protein [Prevotella sp.]
MLKIFKIKQEERWLALVALLVMIALNALVVIEYYPTLSQFSDNYHILARDTFHLSGFDAWSYSVLSKWHVWEFNIYRHPLFAVFLFIPALLNQGLMSLTGINCAIFIMAAIEVFFGFYSAIFLYRIFREVVGVGKTDSHLLTLFFFSFAFIILTVMSPDHFNMSMCMMLICLYIAGRKIDRKRLMTTWQTLLLFFFTAGVSMNNGIKIFLAALFTNGKKFFHPRFFLLAVIFPSLLVFGIATFEFKIWSEPMQKQAQQAIKNRDKFLRDSIFLAVAKRHPEMDSATVQLGANRIIKMMAYEKYMRNHTNPKIGDPMSKKGFMAWTDASTDRWRSIVENLFGESIQLHKANLLQDIMKDTRPMIVPYEKDYHYWIEALIVMLFVGGIVFAFRKRFFWLVFSWFAFDMAIFIVLGFGINELYIMTSQWAFIIPISIGYLLKRSRSWLHLMLQTAIGGLSLYLILYNGGLILKFMNFIGG